MLQLQCNTHNILLIASADRPQRGINQTNPILIVNIASNDVDWHVPLRLDSCHPGSHPKMMLVELFLLVRQHLR